MYTIAITEFSRVAISISASVAESWHKSGSLSLAVFAQCQKLLLLAQYSDFSPRSQMSRLATQHSHKSYYRTALALLTLSYFWTFLASHDLSYCSIIEIDT